MPLDNIDKCASLIAIFLSRRKVTLKEIHSLTNMLRFASSVVIPGPAFLNRLMNGRSFFLEGFWDSSDKLKLHIKVLELFLAENDAMGNSLILDYTRTLLCLSFI